MNKGAETAVDSGVAENEYSRLDELLESVNAASGTARNSWLGFVGLIAFFFVTIISVTHKDLLLNTPVKLPIIGVGLPLQSFFTWAPLVFVLVHFSVLLQHVMLTRKLRIFDSYASRTEALPGGCPNPLRNELGSYFFTQSLAGAKLGRLYHFTLDLMAWLTFAILPLTLLLYFQVSFLPYHDWAVTWTHRAWLMFDIGVLLWVYWILRQRGEAHLSDVQRAQRASFRQLFKKVHWEWGDKRVLLATTARVLRGGLIAYRLRLVLIILGGFVFFVSFAVTTLPDRPLDRAMTNLWAQQLPIGIDCNTTIKAKLEATIVKLSATKKELDEKRKGSGPALTNEIASLSQKLDIIINDCDAWESSGRRLAFPPTALLFEGKVDVASGKATSWFARNLVITDTDLVKDEDYPLKDGEVSLHLRGRNLNYGIFDRSDLHLVDLFSAKLNGASLSEVKFGKTNLGQAELKGANLSGAQLQGANLRGAELQGANLLNAQLQGANLNEAELQGAELSGANLNDADLGGHAQLQCAIRHHPAGDSDLIRPPIPI